MFSKFDEIKIMMESFKMNQETMKDEVKEIKESVVILTFDKDCLDVSKMLILKYFTYYKC